MQITIDTHLHIYPDYDIERALVILHRNLLQRGIDAGLACLTEAKGCDVFGQLAAMEFEKVKVIELDNPYLLKIEIDNVIKPMYLIRGQQIITEERLEVLRIFGDRNVEHDSPTAQVIAEIQAQGAVAIIPWGLGKWTGQRAEVIKNLIEQDTSGDLLIGDSTMRPVGWEISSVFTAAKDKGLTIVHGSDPLPFAGEEKQCGSYVSHIRSAVDIDVEALDARGFLELLNMQTVSSLGKRSRLLPAALRTYKLKKNSFAVYG